MSKSITEHALWSFGVGQDFGYLNVESDEFGTWIIKAKRTITECQWLAGVHDRKQMERALRARVYELRLARPECRPSELEMLEDALESWEKAFIVAKDPEEERAASQTLQAIDPDVAKRLGTLDKRGFPSVKKVRSIVSAASKAYAEKYRLYKVQHERAPLCYPSLVAWLWYLDSTKDRGPVGSICADCTADYQERMRQQDKCGRPYLNLEEERAKYSGGDEWSRILATKSKCGRPSKQRGAA